MVTQESPLLVRHEHNRKPPDVLGRPIANSPLNRYVRFYQSLIKLSTQRVPPKSQNVPNSAEQHSKCITLSA
jgi:hypothetical protein